MIRQKYNKIYLLSNTLTKTIHQQRFNITYKSYKNKYKNNLIKHNLINKNVFIDLFYNKYNSIKKISNKYSTFDDFTGSENNYNTLFKKSSYIINNINSLIRKNIKRYFQDKHHSFSNKNSITNKFNTSYSKNIFKNTNNNKYNVPYVNNYFKDNKNYNIVNDINNFKSSDDEYLSLNSLKQCLMDELSSSLL